MFDVCIIGGGTAGISAARTASAFDLKTVMFEKSLLGGVCLNHGCVPSKIYLQSLKNGDNSPEKIYEKFDKIRNSFQQKIKADLNLSGVKTVESEAEILPKRGDLFAVKSGESVIESKFLIIASGSVPKNEGIFFPKTQDEIPENIDIVGGAIAGFEAAQIFNALGSKVRVLEKSDGFCVNLSQNAVNILVNKMQKNGIEFVKNFDGEIRSNAYFANGRKFAAIKGSENLSLEICENSILSDEYCRTSVENCFAIGDINSKSMLAHTATQEGICAINKIMGNDLPLDYESVPSVLYTDPSIVRVGVLPNGGEKYELRKMPLSGNAKFRATTDNGERGLCEAVIEKESQRIVGLHLISPGAEELSAAMSLIVGQKMTVNGLRRSVFAHPTISEIITETVFYGRI